MQWRKLFDLNPLYGVLSDKLAVREFIAERVGSDLLVPLLWTGNDPDAVPFDTLEPPYVIKSSHGWKHVIIVQKGEQVDIPATRDRLRSWLSYCHGAITDEPGYVPVPRRLMVERMLDRRDGKPMLERKVFVFNGRARFVQTLFSEQPLRHGAYHNREWQPLHWYRVTPNQPELCPRPEYLEEMLTLAEQLAKGLDHLRVDFYDAGDRIWVGELTVYSFGGFGPFTPDEADELLGSYWTIERPVKRALGVVLWRRPEIPGSAVAALRGRSRRRVAASLNLND